MSVGAARAPRTFVLQMRRLVTLAVVASWVVLIATLVRKQDSPAPAATTPPPLTDLAARDEWFGVYKDGRKIGHAHRVVEHTESGYRFTEESVVALAMLGTAQKLESTLGATTDEAFALRTFAYTLVTLPPRSPRAARATTARSAPATVRRARKPTWCCR